MERLNCYNRVRLSCTALSNIHGSARKVLFGTTGRYLDPTALDIQCNRLTFPP